MLLAKLVAAQIPVRAGFVIPARTLWHIAEANELAQKLSQTQDAEHQYKVITHQAIPADIARDLLRAIHHQLHTTKACIMASWLPGTKSSKTLEVKTEGDANILESILDVWAQAYKLQSSLIVPAAILIQAQIPLELAGELETRTENSEKQQLLIAISHQQREAAVSVDIRTWVVVSNSGDQSLIRVAKDQWSQLARYIQTIKLWSLANLKIQWGYFRGQFFIISLTPIHHQHSVTVKNTRSILSGRTAVAGITQGVVHLHHSLSSTIPMHSLLVASQLESLPPQSIKNLAGVILEHSASQSVLRLLETHHIPALIQVMGATRRLKPGMQLKLNATHGVIEPATVTPVKSSGPASHTVPLYVATNQALGEEGQPTQNINGIFFRSEVTLASTGNHPLHVIRSRQAAQLQLQLTKAISSYRNLQLPLMYRPATFTSAQLLTLEHGSVYEPVEPNPRLGFFGALRTLSNFEVFDFELTALSRVSHFFHGPLSLVLAGARSPSELKALIHHVRQHFSNKISQKIWWEIETPEQIINCLKYLSPQVSGIIVNLPQLHALSHGIDPTNQDVYYRYSWSEELIATYLKMLKEQAGETPIMIYLPVEQPSTLRLVESLGLAGIIVKAYYAQVAATYIEQYG